MSERITPYARLLAAARKYASDVMHPKRTTMWLYPKARLDEGWALKDLYERVAAAKQLGYEVRLRADDDGLRVEYVPQRPEAPAEWWN